jgi:hypothetical protein
MGSNDVAHTVCAQSPTPHDPKHGDTGDTQCTEQDHPSRTLDNLPVRSGYHDNPCSRQTALCDQILLHSCRCRCWIRISHCLKTTPPGVPGTSWVSTTRRLHVTSRFTPPNPCYLPSTYPIPSSIIETSLSQILGSTHGGQTLLFALIPKPQSPRPVKLCPHLFCNAQRRLLNLGNDAQTPRHSS